MEILMEFLNIKATKNPIERISREENFSFLRAASTSSYLDVSVGA